eukprot:6490197-Amphidinium_carterae.1
MEALPLPEPKPVVRTWGRACQSHSPSEGATVHAKGVEKGPDDDSSFALSTFTPQEFRQAPTPSIIFLTPRAALSGWKWWFSLNRLAQAMQARWPT